jgi:hypothetical protein
VEPLPFVARRGPWAALRFTVPTISAVIAFAALFVLYTATAAPDLTFWDAPELVTAVRRFGIPHPPGTPLYVTVARVVHFLFDAAGPARAVTMVSVTAGALAAGVTAWLVARWTGQLVPAVCAALMSGTMFSVWRNATEAEVYALSLLLSLVLLGIAEQARAAVAAGQSPTRWLTLGAYAGALAVPLHLSALVVAPAAVALAWPAIAHEWRTRTVGRRGLLGTLCVGLALLGLTALVILPLRAQWDPALNEGGATTLTAWFDVMRRAQYAVAPLWPRRAPLWLQLGNVFEWADWQVARAFGPEPMPTVLRTGCSLVAAVLSVIGFSAARRNDRTVGTTLLVTLVCGTVGVALWLNLLAGPSYGAGVLPADALHEARERDYFFVLGWWAWGVLSVLGVWAIVRRFSVHQSPRARARLSMMVTLAVAAAPIVLNYRAVDRTREPEASLPRIFALELLDATPPNGVLLLAGDIDGFPVWYLQMVEQRRLDVTPIIVPLLRAEWYRAELAERARLRVERPDGAGARAAAEAQGRRVAASTLLDAEQRGTGAWRYTGLVLENAAPGAVGLDRGMVNRQRARIAPRWLADPGPSADPAVRLVQRALGCASRLADHSPATTGEAVSALLERVCELP